MDHKSSPVCEGVKLVKNLYMRFMLFCWGFKHAALMAVVPHVFLGVI